jgi:hypothetical protein
MLEDVHYETWWNALSQELRINVLELIPTTRGDRAILSGRLWSELPYSWLRVELRRLNDLMRPAVEFVVTEDIQKSQTNGLAGWDEKIADLMNHGLSDEEIPDYFDSVQACNFIRDYSARLRKILVSPDQKPTECPTK